MKIKGKVSHNSKIYKNISLKYFFQMFHTCFYELSNLGLLW